MKTVREMSKSPHNCTTFFHFNIFDQNNVQNIFTKLKLKCCRPASFSHDSREITERVHYLQRISQCIDLCRKILKISRFVDTVFSEV